MERALDDGTLALDAPGGPLQMTPLLYVCFSRYAQRDSPRAPALLDTARRLLARGANPNVTFETPQYPGNPFPCLYGASGYNDNPALTRLLVEAGARVDDDESIYHSTEHADLAVPARAARAAAARHRPRPEAHARSRGRRRHDAAARRRAPIRPRRTAAARPRCTGRSGAIDRRPSSRSCWRAARRSTPGASTAAPPTRWPCCSAATRCATRCATPAPTRRCPPWTATSAPATPPPRPRRAGGPPPGPPPAPSAADAHLLPDLANASRLAGVGALLAAGIGVDERGEHGATALHFACWNGADTLVEVLLARGADTRIADRTFNAAPGGWLLHGAAFCSEPRGDYAAALRALLAAGRAGRRRTSPRAGPRSTRSCASAACSSVSSLKEPGADW